MADGRTRASLTNHQAKSGLVVGGRHNPQRPRRHASLVSQLDAAAVGPGPTNDTPRPRPALAAPPCTMHHTPQHHTTAAQHRLSLLQQTHLKPPQSACVPCRSSVLSYPITVLSRYFPNPDRPDGLIACLCLSRAHSLSSQNRSQSCFSSPTGNIRTVLVVSVCYLLCPRPSSIHLIPVAAWVGINPLLPKATAGSTTSCGGVAVPAQLPTP